MTIPTPNLDVIAKDECLADSTLIPKALAELNAIYAAAPFLGRLDAEVRATANGWIAYHGAGGGFRREKVSGRHGEFATAEDAIAALRALIEKWRAEIEAELVKESAP